MQVLQAVLELLFLAVTVIFLLLPSVIIAFVGQSLEWNVHLTILIAFVINLLWVVLVYHRVWSDK